MKFPLRSTVQIGRYVASQRGAERYPLVVMLEPTLGCNIACIGCGKIREYESNKARLTVEECLDVARQCPAPVISVCGGEPLIFKGIEDVVAGFVEMKRNVQLCTNALRLVDMLDRFEPDPRLTFVVHLDGMQEIHDYICDYPGLWEIAVGAIRSARDAGFRVTTNTTIFKETAVDGRRRDDGLPDERGRHRRDADRARLPVLADRPGAHDDAGRARGEVPRDPRRRATSTATSGSRARSTRTSSPASGSCRARRGAPSRGTRTAGRARATCSRTGSSRPTRRSWTAWSGSATGPGTTTAASTARSTRASSPPRRSRRPRASATRPAPSPGRSTRHARLRARRRGARGAEGRAFRSRGSASARAATLPGRPARLLRIRRRARSGPRAGHARHGDAGRGPSAERRSGSGRRSRFAEAPPRASSAPTTGSSTPGRACLPRRARRARTSSTSRAGGWPSRAGWWPSCEPISDSPSRPAPGAWRRP